MKATQKTIMSTFPDFMLDFECKCGACRRTCCKHDWNVDMSEQEYRSVASAKLSPSLRELVDACVKPNPHSTSEGDFAYVEMHGDTDCPLLDENGLCRWISETGSCICSTCANFPRTCMRYLEGEYLMPSGGCEAVLEALLDRDEPISLVSRTIETPTRNYFVHITEDLAEKRPLLRHYPQLIEFGLRILQDRSMPLDERVAKLAEGLLHIDEFEQTGQINALPAFLAEYPTLPLRKGGQGISCDEAPSWPVVYVCGEMFCHYCNGTPHARTTQAILSGLGISPRPSNDESGPRVVPTLASPEAYPQAKEAVRDVLETRSVFFEHVAVIMYLKMLMPIREPNVWMHTLFFTAMYAAVKGGLAGLYAKSEPTDEQLVDAVAEIMRMGLHASLMYPSMCKSMARARITNLAAAQSLAYA